jgi:hypothetical protein
MAYEFDTTVLGGLPVTVEFETEYEDGECGYPGHYVTDWWISAVNGVYKKNTDWITKRMSSKENDRVVEEALEYMADY